MNLDQFAYVTTTKQAKNRATDIKTDNKQIIRHWKELNNLHDWMHKLYIAKGGRDSEFNCNTVRLDYNDLNKLETNVKVLEPTPRFTDKDRNDILNFINLARKRIAAGYIIMYESWW